jgi:uncharacterized OsmC-like protein
MSNLRAREALERARRLFLERPTAARKANPAATSVWQEGLRFVTTGPAGETALTDMPQPMGGDGAGANPGWLLRAALASCTGTALAMQAARLGIELKSVEVSVASESDARGLVGIDGVSTSLSNMRMTIKLAADNVPESDLRELAARAATQSPVAGTLRDSPPMVLEVSIV